MSGESAMHVEGITSASQNEDMLTRVGHVTRLLHDSLIGLGLDSIMEQVAHDIPDARDRLNYVSKMTEQAAERVLNATDIAIPLQTDIATGAAKLVGRWETILANPSLKSEYDTVATETLAHLAVIDKNTTETKALLMEIMMAQDFQDLTGQVIKKITALAQDLEMKLVQVLIDFSPNVTKPGLTAKEPSAGSKSASSSNAEMLNGPQIDPNAADVVATQEQVDDLLDSLGF